jgi:two-component system chemotaxis response regulator CheY
MSFRFERLSVLLVDDTLPMRALLTAVLQTLGVGTILTAPEGGRAYQIFCMERPDIVITDWNMKPVDGLQLVHKIRREKTSPNKAVPIIMMSGFSAAPRIAKARDYGVTEFLVKPFAAEDLAKRIAYVITKPRDFIEYDEFSGPDRRRKKISEHEISAKRRDSDKPAT